MGIRLALGATRSSIMALVIAHGLRLLAIGMVLGVAAALAASRLVEARLFGVAATEPSIFAAVIVRLTAVSVLACAIPARRAMRIDPVAALRR
jgi:putative ABC transport system permease protein